MIASDQAPGSPPIWERGDCYPAKPAGHEYGYVRGQKLVGCTRDELIARCAKIRLFDAQLVWHPDSFGVVPAASVDFLYDALRRRFKKKLISQVLQGALITMILGWVAWEAMDNLNYAGLILFVAFIMGARPAYYAWKTLRRFDLVGLPVMDNDPFWVWMRTRRIPMTTFTFAAISWVAVSQVIFGLDRSAYAAAMEKNAVLQGDWWRLFTAIFLHADPVHYLVNMLSLFALGRLLEALASKAHLIVVFLVAAVIGNICSVTFSLTPGRFALGSSGGIMGLLGFLTVVGYRRKSILPPDFLRLFISNIVLVGVIGLIGFSVVDNAAHFGGLLAGAGIGVLTISLGQDLPVRPSATFKIAGHIATIALVVIALFTSWKIYALKLS